MAEEVGSEETFEKMENGQENETSEEVDGEEPAPSKLDDPVSNKRVKESESCIQREL